VGFSPHLRIREGRRNGRRRSFIIDTATADGKNYRYFEAMPRLGPTNQ
jgi:hypothetical protein